jgi:hypothetical protein
MPVPVRAPRVPPPPPTVVLPPLAVSEGDAVGLLVPVSVGVGLAVLVSVGVGLAVLVSVGVAVDVGVAVELGDVRDGLVTGRLAVAVAVGLAHAVVVGVAGRADETAAAICSLDPVGVALTEAGAHRVAAVEPGDAVLPGPIGLAPAVLRAPLPSVPPPPPFCVPLPPVPPPPDVWPPVSTLEVTWPIAWRSGGTASVTIAMNATPASTATGRSQLPLVAHLVRVVHLAPGQATARGRGSESGQAQCPCQTQYRARLTASLRTLSSHG